MTFCHVHKWCNLIGATLFSAAACNGFDCKSYQALSHSLKEEPDEANTVCTLSTVSDCAAVQSDQYCNVDVMLELVFPVFQ